jgi:S-formylglutathione hydrolase FrmB
VTVSGIAILFLLIVSALAFRANKRFAMERRLPMQWWLTGEVTWSAPRWVALSFIPILTAIMLAIFVVMSFTHQPRSGQEHLVVPSFIALGATFVSIQLLHFWLIEKTLRRNNR